MPTKYLQGAHSLLGDRKGHPRTKRLGKDGVLVVPACGRRTLAKPPESPEGIPKDPSAAVHPKPEFKEKTVVPK